MFSKRRCAFIHTGCCFRTWKLKKSKLWLQKSKKKRKKRLKEKRNHLLLHPAAVNPHELRVYF